MARTSHCAEPRASRPNICLFFESRHVYRKKLVLESRNEIRIEHNLLKTQLKIEILRTGCAARRAYAAPVLKQFGLVGTLTQGGTGATSEQNPMCGQGNKALMC